MSWPARRYAQEGQAIEGVGGLRILDDVGVKIHKLKHLKLHAKMILADGSGVSSGRSTWPPAASIPAVSSPSSSATTTAPNACTRWPSMTENSRPLDLTDRGLLADLEKRYADSASYWLWKITTTSTTRRSVR